MGYMCITMCHVHALNIALWATCTCVVYHSNIIMCHVHGLNIGTCSTITTHLKYTQPFTVTTVISMYIKTPVSLTKCVHVQNKKKPQHTQDTTHSSIYVNKQEH